MRRTGAVLAAMGAMLAAAPPAVADATDGLFVLARGLPSLTDVAMLPDGSVVAARDSGVVVLTPDGRRTRVPGFGATGLAVAPDGSVLGVEMRALGPRPGYR
jgi:glucose/arabinose dehydrogenase